MKIRLTIVSVLLLLVEAWVAVPCSAQFVSSDQNKGTYLNYSGRNYENYSSVLLRRKFYDSFGNFLVDGVTIFGLDEEQRPSTSILDIPTSSLSKSRFYSSYFSNLVVLNDSYSGLSSRLILGDAIRTKFTSLTLDKARFNGIRWDAATPTYRGTVLASRVSDPVRMNPEAILTASQQVRRVRDWTTYLLGGHFETDIGDVLTLGATYVNQHQRRASLDSKDVSLRGVPANAVPRVIFVRMKDDSPGDNSGPIIYGPPQIIINGKPMAMASIKGRSPDPTKVDLKFPIQYWTMENYDHLYVATFPQRDTVSQTDYVYYRDKSAGTRIPRYPTQLRSDRIDVDFNLTYAYVIPPEVYSVDFSVVLANDYKVEAAHDWINNVEEYTSPGFRSHADSLVVGNLAVPTFFQTMVQAQGNVKDGSNRRVVTFSYGLVSGMAIYGMNFKLNWNGFNVEGEFARSTEFLKYPIGRGALFDNVGDAYFIRGTKRIGRLMLGAERYTMDPRFTTRLNLYTLDNSYYGPQNTPVPPDFLGFDPEVLQTATDLTSALGGQYIPGRAGGAVYSLVDDNDDNDRWEDGFYHYNVRPNPNLLNGDVLNFNRRLGFPGFGDPFLMGYRQNVNELQGLGDIIRRPDAGIFPGKDKDRDGIPDDDRNSDGIPDYVQDFLTYYTDPPFFNYGDDWNNNGVIDEQENDILPDNAYNPDLNGYHFFGSFDIIQAMSIRIGSMHEKAPARGGKNFSDYLRWTYEASTPRFGGMNLFYVYKRVQDNIPNNGYQFISPLTISSATPEFVFDPLEYKNSAVHQLYVGTVYTQIPGVRVENNARFEHNTQYAIGIAGRNNKGELLNPEEQSDGRLTKFGLVNKIDYTYRLFNDKLALIPQLKIRTQKIVRFGDQPNGQRGSVVDAHVQEFMPIFRIDYRLTDRTDLRFGFQGFTIPGTGNTFNYLINNLKSPSLDEERTTFAITLSNRSAYGGYNVVLDMGYKFTHRNFPRTLDLLNQEREESTIFVTVYAGF